VDTHSHLYGFGHESIDAAGHWYETVCGRFVLGADLVYHLEYVTCPECRADTALDGDIATLTSDSGRFVLPAQWSPPMA
jgi:hypothetical protein